MGAARWQGAMPLPRLAGASFSQTDLRGIDVSNWQGAINWPKVAARGVRFAFLKASQGTTYTDPTYTTNRPAARTAGVRVGAYHFAVPGGSTRAGIAANATAQADYFIAAARPAATDLRPVLDIERTGGLTPTQLVRWTNAFVSRVAALVHARPIVYTSPSFWQTELGDSQSTAAIADLWIAHWTTAASPWVPAANWSGRGWAFWQYSSSGSVNGISGRVDLDRLHGTTLTPYLVGSPPQNTAPPTIDAAVEVGTTIRGTRGRWVGTRTISFRRQWRRCGPQGRSCTDIPGATSATYTLRPADWQKTVKLRVVATNRLGSRSATSAASAQTVDTTPPSPPVLSQPRLAVQAKHLVRAAWTARDAGSGVATYDVATRFLPVRAASGPWQPWLQATASTWASLPAPSAGTYCMRASAADRAGNSSAHGSQRCVAVPLDDRELVRTGTWRPSARRGFFDGTALTSAARGSTLTLTKVTGRGFAVYARSCPGCGRVAVEFARIRLATIDLDGPRLRRVFTTNSLSSTQTGRLRLIALSSGRAVTIDAVAARRVR
jgi:GH25 family lysozyme M1 (1,4-beta-N-acetylmuramidase)